MDQKEKLVSLGSRAWEFRKQFGFSKKLPLEIRQEAGQLVNSGLSPGEIGRALGVGRNPVSEWAKKYAEPEIRSADFKEVSVTDTKPQFEIRVTATVDGVHVELVGKDYNHLQRMIRRLGG